MQLLLAIRHFPHQKIHLTFALNSERSENYPQNHFFSRGLRPRTPANEFCWGASPPPASQDPPRDAQQELPIALPRFARSVINVTTTL